MAGTFRIHEIRRIDGGSGFQTGKNMFRIGGNTFYDWKNKILMKILEFKRSEIGLIVEFHAIPNGFPNQAWKHFCLTMVTKPRVKVADNTRDVTAQKGVITRHFHNMAQN